MGKSVRLGSERLCDRIPAATVVKTGSDSSTAKRSAIDVSVTGPYKLLSRVTVRLKTIAAQWPCVPSKGQNLKPFTSNDDISI